MTESGEQQNDVFLSHNSKDKPLVRDLKRALVAKGLSVWLDEDELRPGMPWQQLLETGIRSSRSVIVAVGKDGIGPWEDEEIQAALILAVNNGLPVIPVLMSNIGRRPKLPMFLGNRTWVDLGAELHEDSVARLVWGITGAKPLPSEASKLPERSGISGEQVTCRLSCLEKISNTLHGRNISFLIGLCDKFLDAEFRLSKYDHDSGLWEEPVDMRNFMAMMRGAFRDGDRLTLEVSGKLQVTGAAYLKTALENLDGYSDDPESTKAKIVRVNDEVNKHLYDPDVADLNDALVRREDSIIADPEFRSVAVINDRLHDVSLPMIPLLAKHFGCELQISFELPDKGIFVFNMGSQNCYNLERRILDLDIPVGTRVTVVTSGKEAEDANSAVKNVLQSLWQCDHWIRGRPKHWDTEPDTYGLIKYAREMGQHFNPAYGHVQNPFISNLVTQSVFVNEPGQQFSKHSALEQLAGPHARLYDLAVGEILKCVSEVERTQTVVPRPGFAIAHAAMARSPRISISFGTYPNGIMWSEGDGKVYLVAMVICAHDTYKTWRDYLRRFSILFRSAPNLQKQLLATRKSSEFVKVLRAAEISLVRK